MRTTWKKKIRGQVKPIPCNNAGGAGLVFSALRRLPTLRLERLPRMADFARLACAAAPAFGWTEAELLAGAVEERAVRPRSADDEDHVLMHSRCVPCFRDRCQLA
jgi:hypothetical protein